MTIATIINRNQTVEVDAVTSIVVTQIVDDGTSSGTSVREFRVFCGADITAPAVFVLRIKSTTPAFLDVATPVLNF